ncbi:MAG: DUF1328 family protein [Xanthomonadales bacterium]|nr:DUF1328 family protein [Xanthomonadales bacterium]
MSPKNMLLMIVAAFVVAMFCGILGFTGVAALAAEAAKVMFLVFVVLLAADLVRDSSST